MEANPQQAGTVEQAQAIAGHAGLRTTKLYDRSRDAVTLLHETFIVCSGRRSATARNWEAVMTKGFAKSVGAKIRGCGVRHRIELAISFIVLQCCGACSYPVQRTLSPEEVAILQEPKIVGAIKNDGTTLGFDDDVLSSIDFEEVVLHEDTLVAAIGAQVVKIPVAEISALWVEERYFDKLATFTWLGAATAFLAFVVWYSLAIGPIE